MEKVIKVLEELINHYAGRDMATYHTDDWKLLPLEEQNKEIQEAMLLLMEIKNANQESR